MNRAHVIDCLLALGLICAGPALAAADDEPAPPQYQPVAAKLLQTRQGLGNVLGKLAAGQEVRIAYFGGSITAANGWRPKTMQWFAEKFPAAKVEEINAAIGGTGSDLGVFRLEHDVLRHRPDLVFVEFAVNDGGASPQQIWRSMEGIVRQIWTANPRTDICFVYTFRVGYEKDLAAGSCPTAASAMEMLAEHYGIPSINVALKTVELQQAGKLVFQSDEPSPAGVIRFSQDGVHPLDEGHQIYTDVIAESLKSMQKSPAAVDHAPQLAKAFVADHWQAAKMAPISEKMLSGEWTKLDPEATLTKRFGERMGTLWETRQPGSKLTFKFRGSIARLYDLLAPDGGQVIIRVDGETRPKPVPRFDSYCTYERIATLSIAENLDPEQVHTVSIEVHPDQPDRSSVAFRLQNPEVELKQPKYQGTNIRASQILLLGDLVE
jgi:lysophospholipase L1-like esterase